MEINSTNCSLTIQAVCDLEEDCPPIIIEFLRAVQRRLLEQDDEKRNMGPIN